MEIYTDRCSVTFRDDSDYLAHFGRKGMKWYQRIFSKDRGGTRGTKESTMTDDELRAAIARGKNVKKYRELEASLATVPKGRRAVTGALEQLGSLGKTAGGYIDAYTKSLKADAKRLRDKKKTKEADAIDAEAHEWSVYSAFSKNAGKSLGAMSKSLSDHNTRVAKSKQRDLSSMSDEELRYALDRLQLEADYRKYCLNNERGEAGRQHVQDVMELAGTVMTTGVAAVDLYSAVQSLRNGEVPETSSKKKKKK